MEIEKRGKKENVKQKQTVDSSMYAVGEHEENEIWVRKGKGMDVTKVEIISIDAIRSILLTTFDYRWIIIDCFLLSDNCVSGMLFDKLESNKECSKLLSRTLRGQIVWRTRSTETPYKSDREEAFFMITVEVKVCVCYCWLYEYHMMLQYDTVCNVSNLS